MKRRTSRSEISIVEHMMFKRRDGVVRVARACGLVVLGIAFFLPISLYGISVYDEGFMTTGAMVLKHGALPYRDFLSMYGPAQYGLTALLFSVFGEALLVTRVAHAATLSLAVGTVFIASRLSTGERRDAVVAAAAFTAAVVIAHPNVGYPAVTATPLLMAEAWLFSRWTETHQIKQLSYGSLLAGTAGLFRWDFGLFGLAALSLSSLALITTRGKWSRSLLVRTQLGAMMPGAAMLLAVYAPLLLLGGLQRWYTEVLRYYLFEFKDWRSIEYVRPTYWRLIGGLRTGDVLSVFDAVASLLYVAVPIGSAVGGVILAGRRLARSGRKEDGEPRDRQAALVLILSVLCVFLLSQMRVRPTMSQGFAAVMVSVPVAAYCLRAVKRATAMNLFLQAALTAVTYGLFGVATTLASQQYRRASTGVYFDDSNPRATWVRMAAGDRQDDTYKQLIRHVREVTKPGEPVFSGALDMSRLFINDAMLYFLVDRPPAVRNFELEPGLANTPGGQRDIVEALESKRVRTVILLDQSSDEPNRTSTSNGVHILDLFVRTHFRETRRFGAYSVWMRASDE